MSHIIKYIFIVTFVAGCNGSPLDARIIGGEYAPENYAPHMVSLVNIDRPVCGGSIVSRCHVLTAAHCLTPFERNGTLVSTFFGRVGSIRWASGGHTIYFSKHYIHPEYNEDSIKNDVGILRVTRPFVWSESVGVIALEYNRVEVESCFVTGWGTTAPKITDTAVNLAPTPDKLQLLYVHTMPSSQCKVDMQIAFENNPYILHMPHICPEAEICTFHSRGHGMCHGDSGSALVCSGRQVGVVSWGMPCAVGAPDIFARVSGMARFIKPIIEHCDC